MFANRSASFPPRLGRRMRHAGFHVPLFRRRAFSGPFSSRKSQQNSRTAARALHRTDAVSCSCRFSQRTPSFNNIPDKLSDNILVPPPEISDNILWSITFFLIWAKLSPPAVCFIYSTSHNLKNEACHRHDGCPSLSLVFSMLLLYGVLLCPLQQVFV